MGISRTLPYGCPYKNRQRMASQPKFAIEEDRSKPGSIECKTLLNFSEYPTVINMFGQWNRGPAGKYNEIPCQYGQDDKENREKWFKSCLQQISDMGEDKPRSIAFPERIGCNLAGGNWGNYEQMIHEFAE